MRFLPFANTRHFPVEVARIENSSIETGNLGQALAAAAVEPAEFLTGSAKSLLQQYRPGSDMRTYGAQVHLEKTDHFRVEFFVERRAIEAWRIDAHLRRHLAGRDSCYTRRGVMWYASIRYCGLTLGSV